MEWKYLYGAVVIKSMIRAFKMIKLRRGVLKIRIMCKLAKSTAPLSNSLCMWVQVTLPTVVLLLKMNQCLFLTQLCHRFFA
jgi:hypothetical protein